RLDRSVAEADASSDMGSDGPTRDLPPFELGYARTELRRKLVEAVLRGDKIGTAGLATDFAPHTSDPLPKRGDRWRLLDFDDEPVGIVETTEVRVVPAGQVDVHFARDEGEGFESVADWRAAHERFWSDHSITDETLIVCERFRLMEPPG
ncbi:MAG: ASCH domain-containing protein, partial [Chloroflexota bacterium]